MNSKNTLVRKKQFDLPQTYILPPNVIVTEEPKKVDVTKIILKCQIYLKNIIEFYKNHIIFFFSVFLNFL